jgi:TetR/AcrR family transcriptional regulator, mexCD-oprJ operon repressor
VRADARRNVERILDATTSLIASDPRASLAQVAAAAGVSRATVYHHFASRDALMDALTERSIAEVKAALEAADPHAGSARTAIERQLRAAWQVIGRYRGLAVVNQRLERSDLRARLAPAIAPLESVIRRGRGDGEFDPELPTGWLIVILIDLVHAASDQVSGGAMDAGTAERALLRTAIAALDPAR